MAGAGSPGPPLRLSAHLPGPPLTGRQRLLRPSCAQPLSRLLWDSIGPDCRSVEREEEKHRQVLTSGEKSRCRLMTEMMVRMMHLFPCRFELHRVLVWRNVGTFFTPPFLPVVYGGYLGRCEATRLGGGAEKTTCNRERISASARSAAPWPWMSRLAWCLRWSRFWCLWTCCWCSSSVLVNGSALGARFGAHHAFIQERSEKQCALVESGDTRRSNTATRWNEWRWYNIMYFCFPPPRSFVMSCVLSPFVIASVV